VELVGRLSLPFPADEVLDGKKPGTGLDATKKVARGRDMVAGKVIALQSTDGGHVDWVPIEVACKTDRAGNFRVPALKGLYKIWVARGAESGPDNLVPIVSD